ARRRRARRRDERAALGRRAPRGARRRRQRARRALHVGRDGARDARRLPRSDGVAPMTTPAWVRDKRLVAAALFLVTLLAYMTAAVGGAFHYDDGHSLVENP